MEKKEKQNKQNRTFIKRERRVYSYVSDAVADFLEEGAQKEGMSYAAYVFAALNFVLKNKDKFDAKESFFDV